MKSLEAIKRLRLEKNKHICVSKHMVQEEHPLHWHSYFEIEILLSGKGQYVINDLSYDMEKKNLFFLTSTDFHYLKAEEPVSLVNLSFDETMVEEQDLVEILHCKNEKAYEFSGEEYERIVQAVGLLEHECSQNGECQKSLLQYVLKCIFRKNTQSSEQSSSHIQCRGIRNAILYLELHFREPVSLQKLAEEAGYHPTYFSELFQSVTGESYIDRLNRLRVGYAKTLLANDFSVTDACFLSGFGSLSNFLSVFKRICLTTPSQFRRLSRKR